MKRAELDSSYLAKRRKVKFKFPKDYWLRKNCFMLQIANGYKWLSEN